MGEEWVQYEDIGPGFMEQSLCSGIFFGRRGKGRTEGWHIIFWFKLLRQWWCGVERRKAGQGTDRGWGALLCAQRSEVRQLARQQVVECANLEP